MPVVRPGVIQEKIVVNGDLENVFGVMSDFSNAHLWDPGVLSSVPEEGFDKLMISEGTSYNLVVEFNGTQMNMKYQITKYKQPCEVVLRGEGDTVRAVDTIKFKKLPNNQVEIDYEAVISLKWFRRPFIYFINNSLNKLGKSAKRGIENYFENGDKNKTYL